MSKSPAQDFPLLKYLDELVQHMRELIPDAIQGDKAQAVHHARVASRRLKAATQLLCPILSDRCRKPFDKVTKCLRRQLGPLRDLDVMCGHLEEIQTPRFAQAVQWMRERFDKAREEAVDSAKKHAPSPRMLARLGTWWGLREEIAQGRDDVDELLARSVHLQLDAFAEQAADLVQAAASSTQQRNDPHQLRIAGKNLRYTLEMAREHGKPIPAAVVRAFKRLQDALGLWHDWVVLTERILCEAVESDLALHQPLLQEQILGLAQTLLRKAHRELNNVARLWSQRGQDLTTQIRAAFPLTPHAEPAEQPERDIGETLDASSPQASSPAA